jgi:hypothetical protein
MMTTFAVDIVDMNHNCIYVHYVVYGHIIACALINLGLFNDIVWTYVKTLT